MLIYAWVLPGCGRQGGVFYETAQDADGLSGGEALTGGDADSGSSGTGGDMESGAGGGNAGTENASGSTGGVLSGGGNGAGEAADSGADAGSAGMEIGNGGMTGNAEEAQSTRPIYIHICGAVVHPGVYEVAADSRLYEVIVLAGGLCADACDYLVNQAQTLTDGMQIYIPTMEEAQALADGTQTFVANAAGGIQNSGAVAADGTQIPAVQGQTADAGVSAGAEAQTGQQTDGATDTRLDLNSATKEQLMTLPGIGGTRAEAIIAYREAHGGFRTVEELMEVSGIKQGVYDRLKDMIKV